MMKSRFTQGLLLLSLLSSVPPLRAAGQGAGHERYLGTKDSIDKAIRLLKEGKLNDAKTLFEKCTKQVPGHYVAYYYLAQLAYENKEYQNALEHIQTAISSLDALSRVYDQKSIEYQRHVAETTESLQQLGNMSRVGSEGGGCMSATLNNAGQSIRKLQLAESALLSGEKPYSVPAGFYFVEGNCLLRLKRNAEAREQYARALQVDPKHTESWNNLSYLWYLDKDPAAALETIREAEAKGVVINPALKSAILEAAKAGGSK